MRDEVVRAIDDRFAQLFPLVRERLTRGADFISLAEPFYAVAVNHRADELVPKGTEPAQIRAVLEAFSKALKEVQAAEQWTAAGTEAAVRAACAAEIAKAPEDAAVAALWSPKVAFSALRVAVTGRPNSPPLFDTIAALGAVRCLERIAAAALKLR
jgi:glutamyl-tRNA synthetase